MTYFFVRTWSSEGLAIERWLGSCFGYFTWFSLIGGICFSTIGTIGFGRQWIKNQKNLFTILTVILIPLLVFVGLFTLESSLELFPPEKWEITNVSLNNTNPLALLVDAKSFYSHDIYFDKALIKDHKQATLASINSSWVEVERNNGETYSTMKFVSQLPAASEETLTLNFNATLPSGNYSLWLRSYRQRNFVSFDFSIP